MKRILKDAEELRETLVKHRRYLHQRAETGFDLPQTYAYVERTLRSLGYTPQKCGKSGIIATIGKGKPVVLLRADMDGLPVKENSGEPFGCKTGNMHACGHDLHAAMLLGAAELLKKRENELKGRVKLLFEPAEEILSGAKDCLENGLLEGEKIDCALMLHVMTDVPMPAGTAIVSSAGVSAPAADFFRITVKGKGCHGSTPWKGVDALAAGAHILLALQTLSAREIPAGANAVLTVGSLQAGQAGNVIADSAVLQGSLRTFDEEVRAQIKTRIQEIARSQAKVFRATAKTEFTSGCPSLFNDGKVSDFAYRTAKKLLGENRVFTSAALSGGEVGKTSGGSEDFAYISREVPSVMVALAAGDKGKGYNYPLHHPKARFDESALPVGAALLTAFALSAGEDGKEQRTE